MEESLIAKRSKFGQRSISGVPAPWLQRPSTQAAIVVALGTALGVYSLGLAVVPSQWAPMLAVVALCPFLGMMIGNIRRMLLAAIIIDVPFSVGTHLNYHLEIEKVGSIAGLNVSITTLALPLLFALWIANLLTRQEPRVRPLILPAAPLLVYIGSAIVSMQGAVNPTLAGFEIFMLVQSLLLFIYVASTVRDTSDILFVLSVLSAAVIVESLFMLLTFATHHPVGMGGIATRIEDGRIGGTMGGPNAAASFLGILVAPALALALAPVARGYRWLGSAAFVFGTLGLALTMSRGGWIAFALSVGLVVLCMWRRGWLPSSVPMSILLVITLMVILLRDSVFARFSSSDAGAAESRVPLMHIAFNMIRDHPIFGVGANNFGTVLPDYVTPEFSADWLYTVHNRYLLIWAEAGFVALLAFLAFLFISLRRGWISWRRSERPVAILALGLVGAVVGQMSHMFVDILNGRQQVQLLFLVGALLFAMTKIGLAPDRPGRPPRSRRRPRRITARPATPLRRAA